MAGLASPADAAARETGGRPARRDMAPRPRSGGRGRPAYTQFVMLMKIFLPAAAAALVLALFMWPGQMGHREAMQLSFATVKGGGSPPVEMLKPRYVGNDGQGRSYFVTAVRAHPLESDAHRIALVAPQADMTEQDGGWFSATADTGVFSQETSQLSLAGGFHVYTDLGYELAGERAEVDLKAGSAASDRPVAGQGPLGTLAADNMRIDDKGNRLHFVGNVRLVVFPGAKG